MRFLLPVLLLLGACQSRTEEIRIGAEPALQATGLTALLEITFEEETKKATTWRFADAWTLQKQMRAGELDVLLTTSDQQVQLLLDTGIAQQARAFAHEEFLVIGPVKDNFGSHGSSDSVEFLRNVARTGALYLIGPRGSSERDRHDLLRGKTGDRAEAGSFIERPKGGMGLVEAIIDQNAFGLARRSAVALLAARNGKRPRRVYQQARPELLLSLWAVRAGPTVRKGGDGGFVDWLGTETAELVVGTVGQREVGLPLFVVGVPEEGASAVVPAGRPSKRQGQGSAP